MDTIAKRFMLWVSAAIIAITVFPAMAMAADEQAAEQSGQSPTNNITKQNTSIANADTQSEKTNKGSDVALASSQPNPAAPTEAKDGLVLEDGHLVNYSNSVEQAISGWQNYEGAWYWFANSAKASESAWVKTGGCQYRMSQDGKMLTGSFKLDGELYYATTSGAIVTGNGWVKADGKWWYPTNSGALRTGWIKSSGQWYWLDQTSGAMATGWARANDGKWYLLDGSGAMLTGWQKRGSWYWLDGSGVMATGWLNTGASWYWLDRDSGAMATGWAKDDAGKWWYTDGSGALVTSACWVRGGGDSWYRVDASGAMATGWRNVSGTWYWMDASQDGKMAANKLVNVNGTYYWFNESGAMIRNSWCKDDAWHWASDSGAMASGWVKASGYWYWLDPTNPRHPMLTGLLTINEEDYFLSASGAMLSSCWASVDTEENSRFAAKSGALGKIVKKADGTLLNEAGDFCSGFTSLGDGYQTYADPSTHVIKRGWIKSDEIYYYVDPSTEIVATGWQKVDGTWYYLNGSGAMQTGWRLVSGTWYYMDASGAMQTGWLKLGDTWYWLDGSGAMATGWRQIGGTWYYFDDSGAWVSNPERNQMADRISGYSSGTKWLIAVNRSTHKVGIFNGWANHWSLWYYLDCVTGAPSTPTITGTFRTSGYTRTCLSTDSRAQWCTQISGGYFFHTVLASNDELGKSLSHGCIRMSYPDAKWIYDNIYAGTTVVIYD